MSLTFQLAQVPVPVPVAPPPAAAPPPPSVNVVEALTNGQFLVQTVHWLCTTGATILLIAVAAWIAQKVLGRVVDSAFGAVEGAVAGRAQARLNTIASAVRGAIKAIVGFFAFTAILSRLGVDIAPIIASAGVVGLAVGFGAQALVKDVVTGFFIILEDQYGVGDQVEVGGFKGVVERMSLRMTSLRTEEGSLVSLPNGSVANVINHSRKPA